MRRRPFVTLATLAGFAVAIWMPIDRHRTEQAQMAALRAEETRLSTELAVEQQAYLELLGPEMTEALARERLGMVRSGERAYVVPASEAPVVRPDVEEPAIDRPGHRGFWRRAASTVGRVFRSVI